MRVTSPFTWTARLRRILQRGEVAFARGDLATAERAGRSVSQQLDQLSIQIDPFDFRELSVSALELRARVRRERCDLRQAAVFHRSALSALDDADYGGLAAVVHLRLGETLRVLGHYPEAERHHDRAVAMARDLSSADPLLLVAALNGLGLVYKDTDRFVDAACHYQSALAIAEGVVGPNGKELADLHHNLAELDYAQHRFFHGEPHARRAIQLRQIAPGLNSTAAAGDFAVLGALLIGKGRYDEAEDALEKSLRIWVRHFGPDHYEVATVTNHLAALYTAREQHARAEGAYRTVIEIKRRVLGADNAEVVALKQHVDRLARTSNGSGDRDGEKEYTDRGQ